MLGRLFRKFEDVSLKEEHELQRTLKKSLFIIAVSLVLIIFTFIMIKYTLLEKNRSVAETMAKQIQDKNVRIAVINRGEDDSFSHEYFVGAWQESKSMGAKVRTLVANYDLISFRNLLIQAGDSNYDGVIIDGGNDEVVEEIEKLVSKGIPVVAFDSTSELSKIEGITMTSQDDNQMMEYALANMLKQLNSKGNIAYLYAKTRPSLVTRHRVYEQFLIKNAGINEVERFEVGQTEVFMKAKHSVVEMLKKHSKGKIDAIFSTHGEMARGAAEAIKESGRKDIKVYAVGFTDADLNMMQVKDSPYVSATGTDLKEIGTVNVRLLLKKVAGEETPTKYKFKPSLITQDELCSVEETINTDSLKKVARGWGENNDFEENWMKKLKELHAEETTESK